MLACRLRVPCVRGTRAASVQCACRVCAGFDLHTAAYVHTPVPSTQGVPGTVRAGHLQGDALRAPARVEGRNTLRKNALPTAFALLGGGEIW